MSEHVMELKFYKQYTEQPLYAIDISASKIIHLLYF